MFDEIIKENLSPQEKEMKKDIISEYPAKIEDILKYLHSKCNITRRNGKVFTAGIYAGLSIALEIYESKNEPYEEVKNKLRERYGI